jgi:hypothetical protein
MSLGARRAGVARGQAVEFLRRGVVLPLHWSKGHARRARFIMPTPVLVLGLMVLVLEGCLLFTDPVNSPPHVVIGAPTDAVIRGKSVTVPATVSDPDGGPVTLDWTTANGACPRGQLGLANVPAGNTVRSRLSAPTFTFTFPADGTDTVCVFVVATDDHGATDVEALDVPLENQPPVADLRVIQPSTPNSRGKYDLYTVFHLSAALSSDPNGDMLQMPVFNPNPVPPAASHEPLSPCASAIPNPLVACLDVGSRSGLYEIDLTVSDGTLVSAPAAVRLEVEDDHPPCIKATDPDPASSPIILGPGEARTFTVREVLDDGSPLPPPGEGMHTPPTFAWKVRENGGAWRSVAGFESVNAFPLPTGAYGTGDVVDVAVTVSDGVAMHLQPACDDRCPAGCPASAQWTVQVR